MSRFNIGEMAHQGMQNINTACAEDSPDDDTISETERLFRCSKNHAPRSASTRSTSLMWDAKTSHLASSSTQEVFLLSEKQQIPENVSQFEFVGYASRFLTLEKAINAVVQEGLLPMVVILDAAGLGPLLEPAAEWALSLSEVAVILLSSSEETARTRLGAELGCSGTLRMPLVASELVQELQLAQDTKKLWLMSHTLQECGAPVSEAIAKRTKQLRADAGGSVRSHKSLGALSLFFEVQMVDASANTMFNRCELVLKRCEELVAAAASKHGALVAETCGDRFTLVTGLDASSSAPPRHRDRPGPLSGAYQVALQVMRNLQEETALLKTRDVTISLRAGLSSGPCFESLVGCARDTLAFFGEPLTEAARLASQAQDGQIGISAESYGQLYPGSASADQHHGCFFALKSDKKAWADKSAEADPPTPAGPRNFLSLAHFARMLPHAQGPRRGCEDRKAVSELNMKLMSRVLSKREQLNRLKSSAGSRSMAGMGAPPPPPPKVEQKGWGRVETGGTVDRYSAVRPIRVLSVDDNPVNQVVIQTALLPLGHDVLTCMDAPDVFEMLADMDGLPDIILLDVMLPSGSGIDVLAELRAKYASTDLPIILVSGKSSTNSIIEGLENGANDYIVKPFDTAELVCRINTQLNVSSLVQARLDLARRDELLNKMLPREIVPRILAGETPIHHQISQASFLVVGIVGYAELADKLDTDELIELLSALYAQFDMLCDQHDVFKVETDADSYIVASGHMDSQAGTDHTAQLVQLGLDMIRSTRRFTNALSGKFLEVQLGISSGPTSAGVISAALPHYCFFGNTVNMAKKMQTHGFPSTITLSPDSKALLERSVECVSLGVRVIPGNGPTETFVVKHKLTPWKHAMESVCYARNFVGFNDGSTMAGSPASRVRAVSSPDAPPKSFRSKRSLRNRARSWRDAPNTSDRTSSAGSESPSTSPTDPGSIRCEQCQCADDDLVPAPALLSGGGNLETSSMWSGSRRPSSASLALSAASTHAPSHLASTYGPSSELHLKPRPAVESHSQGSQTLASPTPSASAEAGSVGREASSGALTCEGAWQDPLDAVLTRAKLQHLRAVLVDNVVDVATLAQSSEADLEALGIKAKGERLRVRRFAQSWQTLYGC